MPQSIATPALAAEPPATSHALPPASVARLLAEAMMARLAVQPQCRIALPGGAPLAALLQALQALPVRQRLDWQHLWLFATDGWDADDLVQLARLPLPRTHVIRPRQLGIGPLDAARDHEQALRAHFSLPAGAVPVFDVLVEAVQAEPGRAAPDPHPHAAGDDRGRLVLAIPHATHGAGLCLSPLVRTAARLRLRVPAAG